MVSVLIGGFVADQSLWIVIVEISAIITELYIYKRECDGNLDVNVWKLFFLWGVLPEN